jgi:predicted TIM-barrel fold metal-dependent hydrolase
MATDLRVGVEHTRPTTDLVTDLSPSALPSAYVEAVRGGVVDLMMGVPATVGDAPRKYDFLRGQLRDRESREEFSFPAEYMFKDVPRYDEIEDPVDLVVAECRRFGIRKAMLGVTTNEHARRAVQEHPDLFLASWEIDPNDGMDGVRALEAATRELGVRAATFFPAGKVPQVPINDKKAYPFYAKCIELDIPIFVCAGVPGPRVPMACQDVALLDEVCWFFPELKLVTRTALAVKLLLKWPNLYYSTSAFAPRHYPEDIVRFANTRGADKVLYAGYYPAGLSLDRIFDDMPDVPFRDHVWPKFLRENAMRLFGLSDLEESV